MEILTSGSFVNLENREKIEQLKYTARELADAASSTEGFVNKEEPARKLALEFWQGLEYMCRESEEATVRNIFTNNFLERLHALRPPWKEASAPLPKSASQPVFAENELSGIAALEQSKPDPAESRAEIEDISSAGDDLILPENDFTEDEEIVTDESAPHEEIETEKPVLTESDATEAEETDDQTAEAKSANEQVETEEIEVTQDLNLPEKEPYQFHKCTVTATIQLLPAVENTNVRKVVLSIRTHDFAPQISSVEISAADLPVALAPELERVLEKYKSDLPFKVMDKMKREKSTAKKTKPVSGNKPVVTTTVPPAISQTVAPVIPQSSGTNMQGSLFGF